MAFTYYGINAWLPDSYVERGWGDTAAGSLLAILNLVAIPSALIVPWLSDRFGTRRRWLVAMTAVFLVGMVGVVLAPEAAYAWVVALGFANGAMFALVLTLPLDLEDEPRRVGALVGMMLGLGYTIGAISPFVLGAIRDATGSFTADLWIVTVSSGLLVVAAAALPRAREVRAHR
jgi:CP family cyanate transporter-like MFS transporter